MENFRIIGYYLCEVRDTPKWLKGIGRQMLSVSGCLGVQHPRWECFMGGWCEGESQEYQEKLLLKDEEYEELSETATRLFDARRMDVDCRFLQLADAQHFHKKYCAAIPCRVISISTTPEYFEIMANQFRGSNSYGLMSGEPDSSRGIGSDILGWDVSGFHSFLCNSLQKGLPTARFNDMGLLENDFYEVIDFAHRMEGLGEPIEWIPCRVGIPLFL